MTKHPIILPYIHTPDSGKELRYALRSWKNIKNWNGEVYTIGDSEPWFKNINHIHKRRRFGQPYLDQSLKMMVGCTLAPSFIAMQDDIYITEPITTGAYERGELPHTYSDTHQRTKVNTRKMLEDMGLPTVDYETHAPMLVESHKLAESLALIESNPNIQWRSLYGNMWSVKAESFEDKKTKSNELPQGAIISTAHYTDELAKLFKRKSKYEL